MLSLFADSVEAKRFSFVMAAVCLAFTLCFADGNGLILSPAAFKGGGASVLREELM